MAKGKGSAFERSFCRDLSLWWSGGKYDDLFWRSAGSGAMAKTRAKSKRRTTGHYGDVTATDAFSEPLLRLIVIELKRGYNHFSFHDMLDKPKGASMQCWEKFYQQVTEDMINAKVPFWVLVTKRDRRDTLIHMPTRLLVDLSKINNIHLNKLCFIKSRVALQDDRMINVSLLRLDEFFTIFKPRDFRSLLKQKHML